MSIKHSPVADKILELWNVPKDRRDRRQEGPSCFRNPELSPEEILAYLRREFGRSGTDDGIAAFLSSFVEARVGNQLPTPEEHFVARCMLDLLISDQTIRIDRQLLSNIVKSFDSILWYRPIATLIEQHLTDCDLLEALLVGLRTSDNEDILLSALNGFRAYHGCARRDVSPRCREELMAQVRSILAQLREHEAPAIREQVRSAEKWLSAL